MAKLVVPHKYIVKLPHESQQQIWRDFEEVARVLSKLGSGLGQFDAVVDSSLSASNSATKQFKTMSDAVAFLPTGLVTNTIGLRSPGGVNVTEIAAVTGGGSTNYHVIGLGGGNASSVAAEWDHNAQIVTGGRWLLENLKIDSGNKATFFTTGGTAFIEARHCYFDGTLAALGLAPGGCNIVPSNNGDILDLFGCLLLDSVCNAAENRLYDTTVVLNVVTTLNQSSGDFIMHGGGFSAQATGKNVAFAHPSVALLGIDIGSTKIGGPTKTFIMNFNGGATSRVYVHLADAGNASFPPAVSVAFSSGIEEFFWDGPIQNITMPSCTQAIVRARIRGTTASLTGPANITINADHPLTLSGANLVGEIFGKGDSAETAVTQTGDAGMLSITVAHTGTAAGTGLNVSGNKNIIDVTNASAFLTAVTNSGAGNILRNT